MCRIPATISKKRQRCESHHPAAAAGGGPKKKKKPKIVMNALPDRMLPHTKEEESLSSPDQTLTQLLATHNLTVEFQSYSDIPNFFLPPTEEEIAAYDTTVLTAVRTQNIAQLKEFQAQGRPLKCSNKYGESLLHLACRKGMTAVTRYLVHEAHVPVQVCDDFGRSPLHDACWTPHPNFDLIALLVSKCPDLLYLQDKRGQTPLQYIRRHDWKAWNTYLHSQPVTFWQPQQLQGIVTLKQ
jgi:hypothetical protein